MTISNIHQKVDDLVTEFVDRVTALAKETALATLTGALDDGDAAPRRVAAKPKLARNSVRARGEKRSRAEITELCDQLREFVVSDPGLRIEQINAKLGTKTRDIFRPLKRLIAEGAIYTKGTRRATTYWPKGKGKAKSKPAAATSKASKRAKKAKKAAAPKKKAKAATKPRARKAKAEKASNDVEAPPVKREALTESVLRDALAQNDNSARRAARALDRAPSTIRDAMKRFGIQLE